MSPATDRQQAWTHQMGANRIVAILLGFLLIFAAIAKGLSPSDSAALALDGWSLSAQLFVIEAELTFGIMLAAGLWRRLTHHVAMVVFAVFAMFALRSVLANVESCGCLGTVAVDPRLTLLVDLAAVTALAITRPTVTEQPCFAKPASRRALVGAVIAALAFGIPLGIARVSLVPARDAWGAVSVGGVVLLEPETWVGKKMPLLGVLVEAPDLASGEWTVFMHHHGCPDCERMRPSFENRLDRGENVLLVETPPFPEQSVSEEPGHTRLPDDREWFVQTPVEIVLRDGVVVSVNQDFPPREEARL